MDIRADSIYSKLSCSMLEKPVMENNSAELISLKSKTLSIHAAVKECSNVPDNITPKAEYKRHGVWCQIKQFLFAARNTLFGARNHHDSNTYVAYEKVDDICPLIVNQSSNAMAKNESGPSIALIKEKINQATDNFIATNFSMDAANIKHLPENSFEYQVFQNLYGTIFSRTKDEFVSYCKENNIPLKNEKVQACFASLGNMALLFGMDGEVDSKVGYFVPRCIGASALITAIMTPIVASDFSELSEFSKKDLMGYAEQVMISKFSEKSQNYEDYQGRDPRDFRIGLDLVLEDYKALIDVNERGLSQFNNNLDQLDQGEHKVAGFRAS